MNPNTITARRLVHARGGLMSLALVVATSLFIFGPGTARGTEPAPAPPGTSASVKPKSTGPVSYLERELIQVRWGWNSVSLLRDEKELPIGYFGGGVEKVFAGIPDALAAARSYRTYRIAGTALYVPGLALLIANLVLVGNNADVVRRGGEIQPLFWVLLGAGAGLSIPGVFLMQGANSKLSTAAHRYNRAMFQRAHKRWSWSVLPTGRGLAASMMARF